jgi:PHO85 cyclin-5
LPLKTYIQETLQRSKTRFSTLQVALYYLILLKGKIPQCNFTMEQPDNHPHRIALQCGRRMFLTALMLASKYLQDRNYSAKAWSKITGLQVKEINLNEIAFLLAIDWKLHVQESTFERWQSVLIKYSTGNRKTYWGAAVLSLRPDLTFASFGQYMLPTPPQSPPFLSYVPPAYMEPVVVMPPPETLLPLRTVERRPVLEATDVCFSPAASTASRGAMCAAMSIAAHTTSQRFCMDAGVANAPGRSALTLETSFTFSPSKLSSSPSDTSPTSPGSMISDHSSQSSRSSSISISSSPPLQTSLLQRATKNAQSRKFHDRYNEVTVLGSTWDDNCSMVCSVTTSPEVYLEAFEESSTSITPRSVTPRKRPMRGSFDADSALDGNSVIASSGCDYSELQQEVRSLLRTLPDASEQIPVKGNGYPNMSDLGMAKKRVCIDLNAGLFDGMVAAQNTLSRPRTGPGMWQGLL